MSFTFPLNVFKPFNVVFAVGISTVTVGGTVSTRKLTVFVESLFPALSVTVIFAFTVPLEPRASLSIVANQYPSVMLAPFSPAPNPVESAGTLHTPPFSV